MTSARIREWVKGRGKRVPGLIVASNFSGFLSSKVKECRGQLRELLRYAGGEMASLVWIEPKTKAAKDRLFPDLSRHVFKDLKRMKVVWENENPREDECDIVHPIQQNGRFRTRASTLHLARGGRNG